MAAADHPTSQAGDDVVEFGPFRLDRARRQLTKDKTLLPLGCRALEILLVLIDHAPAVVSKAALFEQIWPGTTIRDSTLRFHLCTLRKVLSDGDGSRYISTASGKGYAFVEPLLHRPLPHQPAAAAMPLDGSDAITAMPPPATNLPLRLTQTVGREHELVELDGWLKDSRLVMLVGPGGVGKTRLAVELGWRLLANFPAGVWLIDLAPLADRDSVAGAVASALGASVAETDATADAIIGALGKTRPLVIIDNCEHLAEAVAVLIKTLLERAPGIVILATSRKNLQLTAGRVYSLDPLNVPPAGITAIGHFASVELFAQRARAADRQFELTDENSTAVGEICRQLDGLPLALEMAASRLRLLGVERLQMGLGDRLKMLKGAPDGDARHSSLHGMLEWSHSLLAPFDQKVFRRLAIFSTSFPLDAAIAVAGENQAARLDMVDALGRLIDQSLVSLERRQPTRYRLLETLRIYAWEKLLEAGEADAVAERHARHFVTVFDEADACWEETPDPDWIARYQPEVDNLRAALDWALAAPERRQIALMLAASGFILLECLWLIGEGRKYRDRVVPLLDADTAPIITARLLNRAAIFYLFARDPRGLALAEQSAALWGELNDELRSTSPRLTVAQYRTWQGRPDEANALLAQVRRLLAGSAFKKTELRLALLTGLASYHANNIPDARRHLVEALETARALRSRNEVVLLCNLALIEYASGNVNRAIEVSRAALRQTNSQLGRAYLGLILKNLAAYLMARGDLAEARVRLEEAFLPLVESGNGVAAGCLQLWAVLAGAEGRLVEAALLIGSADADRTRRGEVMEATETILYDRLMVILQAGLPPAELDACRTIGAGWSGAEAIGLITSRLMQRPASGSPPAAP